MIQAFLIGVIVGIVIGAYLWNKKFHDRVKAGIERMNKKGGKS